MKNTSSIYLSQKKIDGDWKLTCPNISNVIEIKEACDSEDKLQFESIFNLILMIARIKKLENFKDETTLMTKKIKKAIFKIIKHQVKFSEFSKTSTIDELKCRLKFIYELYPEKPNFMESSGDLKLKYFNEEFDLKLKLSKILYEKYKSSNLNDEDLLEGIYEVYDKAPSNSNFYKEVELERERLFIKIKDEKSKRKRKKEKEVERKRIQNLKDNPEKLPPPCPLCGYKYSVRGEERNNNGVCGPGYESWVVKSWWECKDRKCLTQFGNGKVPKRED